MTDLTIQHVLASPGLGGFFFDDQAAIKGGAVADGAAYLGQALTPGYQRVREPAEAACIQLVLSDGFVAQGDAASVQYSGVGGREPRLAGARLARQIETDLGPQLVGLNVHSFRKSATQMAQWTESPGGLGRAAAYGLSQALLAAAAHAAGHHLMARVVKDEWQLPGMAAPVPLYAQSGDSRYDNVDRMIMKGVAVLPHGLINTPALVGANGEALEEYIRWIRARLAALSSDPAYQPILHLDVYGQIGVQAGGSLSRTADIIQRLEAAAGDHEFRLEHPIHAGSRDEQIELLLALREELRKRGSRVRLVADEWANTLEDIQLFAQAGAADFIQIKTPDLGSLHHTVDAVLACQSAGVGAFLGGTCAETDISARTTVNIGVATGVSQMLAKPGMGVDEGLAIVNNEMNRAVRLDQLLQALRGEGAKMA